MTVMSALARFFGSSASALNGSAINYRAQATASAYPRELLPRDLYWLLKAAYLSNGFYDQLTAANTVIGRSSPSLKAIRSPITPVVDFFGAKAWPDPLVVTTPLMDAAPSQTDRQAVEQRDPVKAGIEAVHRWSNWGPRRREFARLVALYGEMYVKVIGSADRGRVYFETIEPQYVTDFTEDERGFLSMIRIDIPRCDETGRTKRYYTHTELWLKDEQVFRRWDTDGDAAPRAIEDLGTPAEELPLSAFGIDFVPIVRTPFKEIGEKRAIGAVQLALEAVIEADLSATNLHAILFQDLEGVTVLRSEGLDAAGRPLPAPVVTAATPSFDALGRTIATNGQNADGTVTIGKRAFLRLPGNQRFEYAIPPIDFAAALAILKDHDEHLERLLPALAYARISEMSGSDLSGRAIRFKLTPAIDQIREVRANMLEGLRQADEIALTLGQVIGVFPDVIGSFDSGAFEHSFKDDDVIAISDFEEAQTQQAQAAAMQGEQAAGLPLAEILRRAGYSDDAIADVLALATDQAEAAAALIPDPVVVAAPPAANGAANGVPHG